LAILKSWLIFHDGFPENNFKAPDMDAMNVALIDAGSADKTIVLPGVQWLGTNEQMLKPYLRVVDDRGKLKTECGIPIFCYHGQFYHKKWRENQLANRHRCIQGYLKAEGESLECSDSIATNSMDTLYRRFMQMLDHKIIIEKINWRHPELEYEG
jgi:hypothetical protein